MSIKNLIEISRDSRISKEVRKDIIYKIGRAMDDSAGMNYTSDLRDELIKMVNSEEKKRTISLEAYLKMQNERLSHHNWHEIDAAKEAVEMRGHYFIEED